MTQDEKEERPCPNKGKVLGCDKLIKIKQPIRVEYLIQPEVIEAAQEKGIDYPDQYITYVCPNCGFVVLETLKSPPLFIIVRDSEGNPVQIPVEVIPKEIRPDNWYDNFYWLHRPDKEKLIPIISKYLSKAPLTEEEIKVLAQYIFDYASSTAVVAYLFGGVMTLNFNKECVSKLRILKAKAKTRDDIDKMIKVSMDYAIDPL